MISPCPPYYSSALSCLLRSHHALLFRLVASDCLSCSAKLGRSVLSSSLTLSFSIPLASCLHLLSCYSARILSALLCHEAASIWYWEARLRLSHQGTQTSCGCHTRAPKPISVSCVCRGAEARTAYSVRVSSLATGHPLQIKSWMDSTTVWDTSKIRLSRHAWPWPRHAQSDWVRVLNRNWNWNSCAGRGLNLKVCRSAWSFASTWVVCSLELLRGELSRGYTGPERLGLWKWPSKPKARIAVRNPTELQLCFEHVSFPKIRQLFRRLSWVSLSVFQGSVG